MNSTTDIESEVESDNVLVATGNLDRSKEMTSLQLANGQSIRIPTSLLLEEIGRKPQGTDTTDEGIRPSESLTIPIVEERLEVEKRSVVTGKVLLEKNLQEYRETLDVPLASRTFDVERIVLNQPVETAPAVRQEGNTTIYPLVEEQLVLTTKLILKEEVRVTQRDIERRDDRTVTLRRETISITRS